MEAKRTLVKSPPELWAELSDIAALARHLGEFGEIRITRTEPETVVEWEGDLASGSVRLEPSGWGTKVTLTALPVVLDPPPPEPEPEPPAVEPPPPRRPSRLIPARSQQSTPRPARPCSAGRWTRSARRITGRSRADPPRFRKSSRRRALSQGGSDEEAAMR